MNRPKTDGAGLRVLFVADSLYWITATIARQICQYNPWIEPTICSAAALHNLMHHGRGSYPGEIDIAHFLTHRIATHFAPFFYKTTPCVTAVHHIEDDRSIEPIDTSDAIMTVCHQWHNELLSLGVSSQKCVMVRNGICTDTFRPPSEDEKKRLRRRFGIAPDVICIGFSGKQSSNTKNRKGIETFVAAMQELNGHADRVAFAILGPGWGPLVDEQRRQGIHCTYIPFLVDRREVADFYRCLDIFWVTSRIEGGPVPLLEAMSSEIACISSPVGAALEAIEDGCNGFISPFGDVNSYVSTTRRLLADPALRSQSGAVARRTILRDFQASRTTLAVRQLYEVALDNYNKRQLNRDLLKGTSVFGKIGVGTCRGSRSSLSSVPRRLRPQIRAREHLEFMNFLLNADAIRPAAKIALRAARANPLSLDVWWEAARAYPRLQKALRGTVRTIRGVAGTLSRAIRPAR